MFKTMTVSIAMVLLVGSTHAHADEEAAEPNTKSPLLAAGLNFFVPGAGYLYNGEKPLYVSLPMIAGTVGVTYLENFHKYGDSDETLREHDSTAFAILFSSVFIVNTALAIDAYREAKAINRGERKQLSVGFKRMTADGFGMSLSGRF